MTAANPQLIGPPRGPSAKYREVVEWLNAGPDLGTYYSFGMYDTDETSKSARHALYLALRSHVRMPADKDWVCRRRIVQGPRHDQYELLVIVTSRLTDGFLKRTVRDDG